jgi:hypothetical protein
MTLGTRKYPGQLGTNQKWPTKALRTAAAHLRTDRDRVVAELARIAFADITDVLDASGRPLPPDDIPPPLRSVVKAYTVRKERRRVTRQGKRLTETVVVTHVELYSKLHALNSLARHLGMYGHRRQTDTVADPFLVNPAADVQVPTTWTAQPERRIERRAA